MLKRQELLDQTSCLSKAADDEPIFVLRAQDLTAPATIRFWIQNAIEKGATLSQEKLDHAVTMLVAMESWQNRKLPD